MDVDFTLDLQRPAGGSASSAPNVPADTLRVDGGFQWSAPDLAEDVEMGSEEDSDDDDRQDSKKKKKRKEGDSVDVESAVPESGKEEKRSKKDKKSKRGAEGEEASDKTEAQAETKKEKRKKRDQSSSN